jgi:hypothetical protein
MGQAPPDFDASSRSSLSQYREPLASLDGIFLLSIGSTEAIRRMAACASVKMVTLSGMVRSADGDDDFITRMRPI